MKEISFRNDILPLKNQLFRLALRITLDREEAEDIVQEALIKIWNRRDSWNEIESIEAFCYTVCRNLALDSLKKHTGEKDSIDEKHIEQADTSFKHYERTLQQDRINTVKKLVDKLPEKQRSCMQLRDFEGKPYKEIAHILGITEEQVKVNIFRARQAIKLQFQKLDNYGL